MLWREKINPERMLWEILILFMLLYWVIDSFYANQWLKESLVYGFYDAGIGKLGRPALYSLILEAASLLSVSYKIIQDIQFVLFFCSLGYLLTQLYRWTKSFRISLLFLMLMLVNHEVIKYCFCLITESLVMTLLMMILGLLCQWARTGRRWCLWALSFCMGLAIALKSASYAWVACLFILAFWVFQREKKRGDKIKSSISLVLPLIICWLLSASIHYFSNGNFRNESTLGEMLLGKATVIVDRDMTSSQPLAFNQIVDLAEPIEVLIKKTETWHLEYLITLLYYDHLRYWDDVSNLYQPHKESYVDKNKYRMIVAKEIIEQKPMAYLRQIWLNYLAIWLAWDLLTGDEYDALINFTQKEGPLPYYENVTSWNFMQKEPRTHKVPALDSYVYAYRFVLAYVALISLLIPVVLVSLCLKKRKINDCLWMITMAAGMINAVFLLTVVVNNSSFRYSIVMWPAIALVVSLSFCWRTMFHPRDID